MNEVTSKQILKARQEVNKFLNKTTSIYDLALYYKCTLEWHQHRPNDFNTECLRLIDEYFSSRGIDITSYHSNVL